MVGKDFESLIQSMYAFGKTTGREATFGQILGNISPLLEQYKGAGLSSKLQDVNSFLTTAMFVPNPSTLARALRTMQTKGSKGLSELGFNLTKGIPTIDKVVGKLQKINDIGYRNAYISSIFGPQNLLNIQKLVKEYDVYNKAIKESEKQVQIQKDAAEALKDLSSSINRISTVGLIIAEKGLAKPLKELGDWMEKLADDPNLDKYIDQITKLAQGFVLLWGTVKAIQAGKAVFNLVSAFGGLFGGVGGKGGKGGIGLGAMGSAANPMYVIVVAGPMGAGGVPGAGGAGAAGGAAKFLGQALLVAGVATLAFEVTTQVLKAIGAYSALEKAGAWLHRTIEGDGKPGREQTAPVKIPGAGGLTVTPRPASTTVQTTVNVNMDGQTIAKHLNPEDIFRGSDTGQQHKVGGWGANEM
jgi:hypothetical protein